MSKKTTTSTGSTYDTSMTHLEPRKELTAQKKNRVHSILFWLIFFLIIVLITVTGVLELTEIMRLNGQFITPSYTQSNISKLTSSLQTELDEYNDQMHEAYHLDIELSPNYQVYSSADGTYATILYTATFANNTYLLSGNTNTLYVNGLVGLIEHRNNIIDSGKYRWDDNWLPEPGMTVIPTSTPTPIPDAPFTSETDDTEEVIERGEAEEQEE